ncbi:hypothetical protein PR048_009761 [Dryococelus australis]|uniref:Uncharacterized protein n=1 Tax=Dryococelus australis TaxID=614101 RepID=A0ABQ9I0V1_9NEOP|nr:hypothetical protein PR048_009761 [Dryococelus australis]
MTNQQGRKSDLKRELPVRIKEANKSLPLHAVLCFPSLLANFLYVPSAKEGLGRASSNAEDGAANANRVKFPAGFSHVRIVPDDAAGRRVFTGISRFRRPFILALLHTRLASLSSALNTPILRVAQISPLHSILQLAQRWRRRWTRTHPHSTAHSQTLRPFVGSCGADYNRRLLRCRRREASLDYSLPTSGDVLSQHHISTTRHRDGEAPLDSPTVTDIIYTVQRHDGNTARLSCRSDEALGVRVSIAHITPSLLDLGRGVPTGPLLWHLCECTSTPPRRARSRKKAPLRQSVHEPQEQFANKRRHQRVELESDNIQPTTWQHGPADGVSSAVAVIAISLRQHKGKAIPAGFIRGSLVSPESSYPYVSSPSLHASPIPRAGWSDKSVSWVGLPAPINASLHSSIMTLHVAEYISGFIFYYLLTAASPACEEM